MEPDDLRDLFSDLVRLETELWNAADARLRSRVGVTLGRCEVLRLIDRHGGGRRVQEIADELVISQGGVSKLVERLVSTELVRRRSHPTDGRSALLDLTPGGEELLAAADAVLDEFLAERLTAAGVDLDAFASIVRDLRRTGRGADDVR